jgi:motility quorum-sensing regulator/GCU-specific mRNA interferase toxin
MVEVIRKLKPKDFYKSMTRYADHKTWQDVYRPWVSTGRLYLKLTVTDDVLVVSFKEC